MASSSEFPTMTTVCAFVVFLRVLYRFTVQRENEGLRQRLPLGPFAWTIIGNLNQLRKLPHRDLHKLANKYGPIMLLKFGSVPTIVVSSSTMAKEFLNNHEVVFASRPPTATKKYLFYNVNAWSIGTDPSLWDDSLEFRPERFMGKNGDLVRDKNFFDMLLFRAGRRGCPGTSMAIENMIILLAQLVHCFEWSMEGDADMMKVFGATMPRSVNILAWPTLRMPTYP